MANLSQQKRQRMLDFLSTIRGSNTDDETIIAINEIENELKEKKFGLVFEEHLEEADEKLESSIPVLSEDLSREITVNDEPYNAIIEGDNLFSLYLLQKTHKENIDAIYIDPPYNTGARDWKYNNDFVDSNDAFRHSKWASFMKRRLLLAKQLLKNDGIIAVTIDDYEIATLRLLLDDVFGEDNYLGTIVIRNNPSGRSTVKGFSINHEYALFYGKSSDAVIGRLSHNDAQKSRYKEEDEKGNFEWENFRKNGTDSDRKDRPKQFYPIVQRPNGELYIPHVTWNDYERSYKILDTIPATDKIIWPVNPDGIEKVWKYGIERAKTIVSEILVKERNGNLELYRKKYLNKEGSLPRTWWDKPEYSARDNGTRALTNIFGGTKVFDFPKAPEAVKDCLRALNLKKDGIVLDFFAGSGTTGQAVLELNAEDGGNRRFILCSNNENEICKNVTYERIKAAITGKCPTGKKILGAKPANLQYYEVDFVSKENNDISEALISHVNSLIQLEYGVKIDEKQYVSILTDEEADELERNWSSNNSIKAIFISRRVLLTGKQVELFTEKDIFIIPDYYYRNELKEVGEA